VLIGWNFVNELDEILSVVRASFVTVFIKRAGIVRLWLRGAHVVVVARDRALTSAVVLHVLGLLAEAIALGSKVVLRRLVEVGAGRSRRVKVVLSSVGVVHNLGVGRLDITMALLVRRRRVLPVRVAARLVLKLLDGRFNGRRVVVSLTHGL